MTETCTRCNGTGRVSPLTERQKQVADLAVVGKTNAEIAAELRITGECVGMHISNIYMRLKIHSRGELVEKWGRE